MDALEDRANIALVPVAGDLDVTSVAGLRDVLDGLINRGCRRIILSFADCDYIDSTGMGLILSEIRKMRACGGLLSLTNVSDRILRTFRICRVVDVAPVSTAGPRPRVPALDPSVQALWRSSLKVNPDNMADTRLHVARLLQRVPLSEDGRFDANLAIGEAIGNAVDHTESAFALVTLAGYADRVVAEISDCGCGFDCSEEEHGPRIIASEGSGGATNGKGIADEEVANSKGADGKGVSRAQETSKAAVPFTTDQVEGSISSAQPAERGRGIKLMRLLADSVEIHRRPSGGTVVRIVKLVG